MKRNACGTQRPLAEQTVRTAGPGGVLRLGAGLAVALLAACGAPARPLPGASADLAPRQAVACVPEREPTPLPAIHSLIDTGRLSEGLRALQDGAGVESGEVVLTLWYDEAGTNVRRDVIRHTLTPSLADSVQELLFASLAPVAGTGRQWGARMLISLGSEVPYALGHRVYCPPRPLSRTMEAEMASFNGTGVRYRAGRRERLVLMEATVAPGGYVDDARIVRGAASGSSLEKQLRETLRQYSFEPASLDGVPVYGAVTVPVRTRE
jgi:hypothetical protein